MVNSTDFNIMRATVLPQIEARIATRSNVCYHKHSHDEFSFGIIDAGCARYDNRSRHHPIGRGDLVTINPADIHACNPHQGVWSYRMLFVDTLWLGKIQHEVLGRNTLDYYAFVADFERGERFRSQFEALFDALLHAPSSLCAETLIYELLEQLYGRVQHSVPHCSKKAAPHYLLRAREKLFDEIDQSVGLEVLAQEVGVSRYHLIRTFKQWFGLSPHAYLMDERIKRAKQMLKQGTPIVDTSLALGFADQAHFQRSFKSRIALTPKKYQSFFTL